MSRYDDVREQIESSMCLACGGLGEYDDADIGDISYNTYYCNLCNGTGFQDGVVLELKEVK